MREPTPAETSSAMSSVYFRWSSRFHTGLTSIFKTVRPKTSFRTPATSQRKGKGKDDDPYARVGTRSAPNDALSLARHRSSHIRSIDPREHPREKGKSRAAHLAEMGHGTNKSTTDVGVWDHHAHRDQNAGASMQALHGSSAERKTFDQHAHAHAHGQPMVLQVPMKISRGGSPVPSPTVSYSNTSTQASSPLSTEPTSPLRDVPERPRSRLSISSWMRNYWPKKLASSSATPSVISTTTTPEPGSQPLSHPGSAADMGASVASINIAGLVNVAAGVRERMARRSDDAFSKAVVGAASAMHGGMSGPGSEGHGGGRGSLTLAVRASSYSDVHTRPSEDLTSLYSAERADDLDDDTFLIGAGGVAHSTAISIPSSSAVASGATSASGLMSTMSSANSLAMSSGAPMSTVHAMLQRGDHSQSSPASTAVMQDIGAPDPGAHTYPYHSHHHRQQTQSMPRVRTTSPLSQPHYRRDISLERHTDPGIDQDEDADSGVSYDEYDDELSSFGRRSQSDVRQHSLEDVDDERNSDSGSESDSESVSSEEHVEEAADRVHLQPSTSQRYHDEDEESEDEEHVRLEVRTRRPSASASTSTSPGELSPVRKPVLCS